MEFSARHIYGGQLRSAVAASDRPPVSGFVWPVSDAPLAFIETGGPPRGAQEESDGSDSKRNPAEAERVLTVLDGVLSAGEVSTSQIGVVTPYKAQVRLLRSMWRERGGAQSRQLEIASVDNFQGREKELVIFSAVRANRGGRVGFLADWRRLNVLLTRARRGLVVVGCGATLRHDALWQQWLEHAEGMRVVIDKERWHEVLWRAMRMGTDASRQLQPSLHALLPLDYAPDDPDALMRHVEAELGTETRDAVVPTQVAAP